jgi:hypothetical protein
VDHHLDHHSLLLLWRKLGRLQQQLREQLRLRLLNQKSEKTGADFGSHPFFVKK